MGGGQNSHERPRLLFLHRVHVQRLVHAGVPHTYHGEPEPLRVHQELGEPDRHGRDPELLPGPGPAAVRLAPRERGHPRILEHHTHHETVQADAPLLRPQDPDPDVPRVREGADPPRLLPGPRHRDLRQSGLLRGTDPVQSEERLQEHTVGPVVGPGHDDHRRLRGHGAENLRRNVRRRALRPSGRTHDRPAGARDRQQLCDVLQSHAGASKITEEATPRTSGRTAQSQDSRRARNDGRFWRTAGMSPTAHATRFASPWRRPGRWPGPDARGRLPRRTGTPEQKDERYQDQSSQGRYVRYKNR